MKRKITKSQLRRSGAIAVLVAILSIPLFAMVAFALDYGYLLVIRTDLQRAADAAALAAVRDLIPDSNGVQDLDTVRAAVREYAALNITNVNAMQVLDSDIEIGRYDPNSIYSGVTLLNTGVFDTVRVRLRRDSQANSPVSLFFAPIIGIQDSGVSAVGTALLQKISILGPGADVLALAVTTETWNALDPGETFTAYGDGRLEDENGGAVPGNWGTCDIGPESNSTSDLRDQMLNGLRQEDLDALYADGRISQDTHINSSTPAWLNGDPGLSSGMSSAIEDVHGQTRLVPIYDTLDENPHGSNVEFHVVAWGVVEVVDSYWQGSQHSYVQIRKSYLYDSDFPNQTDLSDTTDVIEGAYSVGVLAE